MTMEGAFHCMGGGKQMLYLSVAEMAKKWDVSERSVRNYGAHGRVLGVFLSGKTWNIPGDAKKRIVLTRRKKN